MKYPITVSILAILSLSGCGSKDSADSQESEQQDSPAKTAEVKETTPYSGTPHVIPGLIEAEHYDLGAPEIAYHDIEEKNLGVDYRTETQVDIEQRDDASNGHGIGWTRTGEWLNYTVSILEAGEYEIEFPVASDKQGGVFHLDIDGVDITGPIEIPDTGGWKNLKTISAKTIRLNKGQFIMKMLMDRQGESGSIGDIDYLRFVLQSSQGN